MIDLPDIIVGGDQPAWGINALINPKNDPKFSPNLWRFLTWRKKVYTNIFQCPKSGIYYIGLRDAQSIWCGAHLMGVFCRGNQSPTFSYGTSITKPWNDVTKWFWSKYLDVGKSIYYLPEWDKIQDELTDGK